jgi:hypothetical protein
MRYPTAFSFTPGRSRVYLTVVGSITIILIALCAYSMPAGGHFRLQNGVWMLFAAVCIIWLLIDALRRPRGQLVYAQGRWARRIADQQIEGTLRLHLDLQNYILASFEPSADAGQSTTGIFSIKTQWFHLEARHADHGVALASSASQPSWQALRCAVHAPGASHHEELAA